MRLSHVLSKPGLGPRRRFAAGAVGAALALAACGGGSDSSGSGADAGDPLPDVEVDDSPSDDGAAPAAVGAGYVDLVGPDVIPGAEIDTNLLPSVVVDDLTNDRKVNFRNLVPQEKPVLLWMWAPH
jgi:hypothetical protein